MRAFQGTFAFDIWSIKCCVVDIWSIFGFFLWLIFDKTPVAGLNTVFFVAKICKHALRASAVRDIWWSPLARQLLPPCLSLTLMCIFSIYTLYIFYIFLVYFVNKFWVYLQVYPLSFHLSLTLMNRRRQRRCVHKEKAKIFTSRK